MEQSVLAFHKSPKRKRHELDASDPALPAAPAPLRFNQQENHFHNDVTSGRNSPPGMVAGRFRDLDIRTVSSPGCPLVSSDGNPTDIRRREEPYKSDKEPSGNNHSAPAPTETPLSHESKESPEKTPVSQNKIKAVKPQTSPARYKSPPLIAEPNENPFTWHESEITGHNPTDPSDDGYGMNGIGFKPTAAEAWDRAQRRKKQVAEWNKRESREARDRRREKRDGVVVPEDKPTEDQDQNQNQNQNQKRVKFDA